MHGQELAITRQVHILGIGSEGVHLLDYPMQFKVEKPGIAHSQRRKWLPATV